MIENQEEQKLNRDGAVDIAPGISMWDFKMTILWIMWSGDDAELINYLATCRKEIDASTK